MASYLSTKKLSWILFGTLITCNVLFWYGFSADQATSRCVEIISADIKKGQEYKKLLQNMLESIDGESDEY